jgi:hypothetical protein
MNARSSLLPLLLMVLSMAGLSRNARASGATIGRPSFVIPQSRKRGKFKSSRHSHLLRRER